MNNIGKSNTGAARLDWKWLSCAKVSNVFFLIVFGSVGCSRGASNGRTSYDIISLDYVVPSAKLKFSW
jgi:hypothetical protein